MVLRVMDCPTAQGMTKKLLEEDSASDGDIPAERKSAKPMIGNIFFIQILFREKIEI